MKDQIVNRKKEQYHVVIYITIKNLKSVLSWWAVQTKRHLAEFGPWAVYFSFIHLSHVHANLINNFFSIQDSVCMNSRIRSDPNIGIVLDL